MDKYNPLIKKYGGERRWVNYRIEERKGKKTKIPVSPITRKLASSADPATWSNYEETHAISPQVGIVFTPDQTLLGIDIDHCLKGNNIDHEQKESIAALIIEADTYTEISPSGEGLHLFLAIDEPLALSSNKSAPFEAYTSGRYFTVTGNVYKEPKEVRSVSAKEALDLLAIIGYPWKKEEKTGLLLNASNYESMKDEQVLAKMFASKKGKQIKALYDGDLSANKNDASNADLSLCSHLAFWTGKSAEQIERIWSASPLGSRKKTSERKDYRLRTIAKAIASCKEVYKPKNQKTDKLLIEEAPEVELLYTSDGKGNRTYIQNTENMCRILRGHPEFIGRFRYDAFKNTLEIKDKDKWRGIEDNDAVNMQTRISILFSDSFGTLGKLMMYDAIIKVCKENKFDSAIDFIKSTKWDGEKRLDLWLSKTYGVEENVYHCAVASNWIKGLVKRIIEPGCKFDYVLVLEGEQGSKKSTSLSVLGRDWHVETTMSTDTKDFFMQFQGKAIVEFSEGETFSRTEVKRMKAIITMQTDKYRPPYERTSQDFPRRCVFAMTTNQTEYLKDETGNRRWLPVAVVFPEANIEWLEENRNQIFAEAYHRVIELKESIHEFPKDETKAMQDSRKIHDENYDVVAEWYYEILSKPERDKGITIHQAFKEAIVGRFSTKPLDKYNEMKVAEILKNMNLIKRREMKDGFRAIRWFDKDAPIQSELEREQTNDEIVEELRNSF